MHLLKNDWSTCSDIKCRVCAEKRVLLNTTTESMRLLKEFSGLSTASLKALTKNQEWKAMLEAFENDKRPLLNVQNAMPGLLTRDTHRSPGPGYRC